MMKELLSCGSFWLAIGILASIIGIWKKAK